MGGKFHTSHTVDVDKKVTVLIHESVAAPSDTEKSMKEKEKVIKKPVHSEKKSLGKKQKYS